MEEGLLPHEKSVEECSVEEERRLLYVGITRARRHLTISRCLQRKKYGKYRECQQSRFIEELPEHLLSYRKEKGAEKATAEEADKMAGNFFAKMQSMLGG
jgi:superfamily I DNA/RNA helicase